MYNEASLYDCCISKAPLNVCSTQKSLCSFPFGLKQKSVLFFGDVTSRPHLFPGLYRWVLIWPEVFQAWPRPAVETKEPTVLSPLSTLFLSGFSPSIYLYLVLKLVSSAKRRNNSAVKYVYSIFWSLSLWDEQFFTSICKSRDILLFLFMLQWTFAFCLAPFSVSPSYTSSKLLLTLFSIRHPLCPCVSLSECFLYFLFLFAGCIHSIGCNRRATKAAALIHGHNHQKSQLILFQYLHFVGLTGCVCFHYCYYYFSIFSAL